MFLSDLKNLYKFPWGLSLLLFFIWQFHSFKNLNKIVKIDQNGNILNTHCDIFYKSVLWYKKRAREWEIGRWKRDIIIEERKTESLKVRDEKKREEREREGRERDREIWEK